MAQSTGVNRQLQPISQQPEMTRQYSPVLAAILTEISIVLEDLQVTTEQLQQHYQDLSATHKTLEDECQLYQNLGDFTPGAYVVTNSEGIIQTMNRAAESLFNIRRDQAKNTPLLALIAEADHDCIRTHLDQLAVSIQAPASPPPRSKTRRSAPSLYLQNLDVMVRPRHRSVVRTSFSLSVANGGADSRKRKRQQHSVRLYWHFQDLRQHQPEADRQAVNTLRESEALYDCLFDSIDEGVCLFERLPVRPDGLRDYRFLAMNPSMQAMFGISDLSGQSIRDNFPNEVEDWYDTYDHVLDTGEAVRFERESQPQGMVLEMFVTRVEDRSGQRLLAVMQNVTERKRREANLAFLSNISDTCSRLPTAEEIVQAVGAKIGDYLQVVACNFCEIDEVGDQVIYFGRWQAPGELPLPDKICLSEQVSEEFCRRARAGETIVSHNTQTNPVTQAEANASIRAMSFITVPFHTHGDWRYLFSIHDKIPRIWRDDEIELVQELANRLFPRLEHARGEAVRQKRAEATLQKNEDLLRFTLAGARSGNWEWEWDLTTGQFNWHEETFRLFGLNPTDGKTSYARWFETLIHPDDRERVQAYAEQVLEERLPAIQIEFRILHPQLGIRWLLGLGRLTFNEEGQPIRLSGINLDISDLKLAEAALRESEEKLQFFVRFAPASVAMFNRNMQYMAVSQRWVDSYNLGSIAAILGRSHYEVIPNLPDRWRQVYQQGLEGRSQTCDEDSFLLPDGTLQWLKWEVQPWHTETGEVGGILIFVEDITNRKATELVLQQQIQREQLLAVISQEIRQSLDFNTVLSHAVERIRNVLNCDRVIIFRFHPNWQGDVIMESVGAEWPAILSTTFFDPCFSDRYIEPYRSGRIASIDNVASGNWEPCYVKLFEPFQIKAFLAAPILQNEDLWGLLIAHHCAAPHIWEPSEIDLLRQLAIQVSIATQQAELYQNLQTELAERKLAERKIREQAALLDITSDAIFVRDLDHHILYWNQGAERMYGWSATEAIGHAANELFPTEPETISDVLPILIEQGEWRGEIDKTTKANQKLIVDARWTIVRDDKHQPRFYLCVETDITDKKRMEAQFYQAQRLESLGTLAGGVAHDLNNILTPILGISQLFRLTHPNLNAKSLEMVKVLEDSAKRGANLVKQILALTRGSDGERVPIAIATLLQEVFEIIQQTFPKSIEIQFVIPDHLSGLVSADPTHLHQVLMNLCVNARDAMPNGGVLSILADNVFVDDLYAQMNLHAHAGHHIRVTIADTGTGIPPEVRDRLFEPFFTTKDPGKGTGLGLSTVLGIVKNYGGFIQVVSEVGQGSQFKIYLPTQAGNLNTVEPQTKLPQGNQELILIVDDDLAVQRANEALLVSYGYRTLVAQDGPEAIGLCADYKHEIRVILIDIMMPHLDGVETIRVLQNINAQIPIIAVSGLATKRDSAIAAGATTFLPKPYTAEDLLRHIHQLASKRTLP